MESKMSTTEHKLTSSDISSPTDAVTSTVLPETSSITQGTIRNISLTNEETIPTRKEIDDVKSSYVTTDGSQTPRFEVSGHQPPLTTVATGGTAPSIVPSSGPKHTSSTLSTPAIATSSISLGGPPSPFPMSLTSSSTKPKKSKKPVFNLPSPNAPSYFSNSSVIPGPSSTSSTCSSPPPSSENMIENTGRWTTEEHHLFLQGLEQHGKGWKKIASLIKSRTVVQIRTHAQKYFQKLAKARQGTGGSGGNGVSGSTTMDDNGISLDSGTLIGGMGGISTSSSHATGNGMNVDFNINGSKRRRQANSKKRKAISSVVSSAQRELKKQATANSSASGNAPVVGSSDSDPTVSGISPYLSHFVHPVSSNIDSGVMPSICTSNASISGSALEESLFRFLTPMSESESTSTLASTPPSSVVNEVARKAGANPIVLPSSTDTFKGPSMLPQQQQIFDGGVSPTGVSDIDSFPSWVSGAPPAWFTKGADVDELLTEAEALDWLADSGDLNESYNSPPSTSCLISEPSLLTMCAEDLNTDLVIPMISDQSDQNNDSTIGNSTNCTTNEMPPLLSLFDSTNSISDDDIDNIMKREKSINLSSTSLFASATEAADATDHFSLFDTQFDEQAFVTALLDQGGSNDSTNNLLNSY